MHVRDARKSGETQQRLAVISAWKDTKFFTEEEQAILALTEEMTNINRKHVSDETYKRALDVLGETKLSDTLMAIVEINAWNRIAITTGLDPAPEKE